MVDIGTGLDTLDLDGELKPIKPKKKHTFWRIFFRTCWIVIFTGVISISAQVIYEYTRYSSFFVSGDSMYPTLNKDATRTSNGVTQYHEEGENTWGDYLPPYSWVCDYGLMDSNSGFVSNLRLFDIVVTYYDDDFNLTLKDFADEVTDSKGNKTITARDMKIKRLYGLPGDSLYFDADGAFHLKKKGDSQYVVVAQPSTIENDEGGQYLKNTIYSSNGAKYSYASGAERAVTLKDGEYFVVGDNRRLGASLDSRSKGPLGSWHYSKGEDYPTGEIIIKGRAVAITGKSELSYTNGVSSHKLIWTSLKMPWNISLL